MTKTQLINTVSRSFHKVSFQLKKHSPEIMVVAGVIGTVASGVMACKATLKVHDVIDAAKSDIEDIHEATETGVTKAGEEYSVEDSKKDLAIVYAQTGLKFVKLYGPAVLLGGMSVTSILTGHNILRKRNIALATAYAAVDKSFKEYRGRVVERFGKELDRELRYNIKAKEIEEIVVDEDGNEKIEKKTVEVMEGRPSVFAVVYDDGCNGWSKDPETNKLVLRSMEATATKKLERQGYLFLNEVYEMLGVPKTQIGQTHGWIYDEKNPNGDNYVDFGLYNIDTEAGRRFINGLERNVIIEPNVDGYILDKM